MEVFVESVGIVAPGLLGWPVTRRILNGDAPYIWQELPVLEPAILPPIERRRSIVSARLGLTAAYEALSAVHGGQQRPLASVFASSDGDGRTIHQIAESLAEDFPEVSPTRFSNSVHNAVVGYWSIAARLTQPSTSICACDETFAAALLEAAGQAVDEQLDVLMTAFDMRFPPPFSELRATAIDCAVTLLLTPRRSGRSIARLRISLAEKHLASPMPPALPKSFTTNPAARALPLLAALAAPNAQAVYLDYLDQSLAVTVAA
jgi:hypothetical protein